MQHPSGSWGATTTALRMSRWLASSRQVASIHSRRRRGFGYGGGGFTMQTISTPQKKKARTRRAKADCSARRQLQSAERVLNAERLGAVLVEGRSAQYLWRQHKAAGADMRRVTRLRSRFHVVVEAAVRAVVFHPAVGHGSPLEEVWGRHAARIPEEEMGV